MQWRIQETDRNRVPLQSFIQCLEVTLLVRKDFFQGSFSLFYCIGTDHLTECSNPVFLEEHMLGTAKADSLCSQLTCFLCVSRCIRICTNLHGTELVCPSHDAAKLTGDSSIYGGDNAVIDITGRSINGDWIPFVVLFASQCKFLILFVHVDVTTAGYTACTHTTGNYGCMGCHTAADGKNTLGSFHTGDILRRCLQTYQNDLLTTSIPLFCVLSSKYYLTTCRSRRSPKCLGNRSSCFQCGSIKLRVKKGIQITRIDHGNCLFFCSHSLIYQIAGNLKGCLSCPFAVTCLKHVEFLVLNGKLHILHISVVIFQCGANLFKLSECLREFLLHLSDGHRCADTGNYVLALCVLQELAHKFFLTGSRITGKGNTGTTIVTHVTECHRLYVYSGTPGIRDIVVTTVYIGTRVVP